MGKVKNEDAKLTGKQLAFINEYFLSGFNATEAARRAGYVGDDSSLAVIGFENLRKLKISDEIERRMAEQTIAANEMLLRLASHARGDYADIADEDGSFDYRKAKALGKTHLIKKLKRKRTLKVAAKDDEDPVIEEYTEVELYDAQAAINTLIKELHLKAGEPTDLAEIKIKAIDYRKVLEPLAPDDTE